MDFLYHKKGYVNKIQEKVKNNDCEIDYNDLSDNHNEFQFRDGHPLQSHFHCYPMHHLMDHTILSYSDLLEIGIVWVDVKLKVQTAYKADGEFFKEFRD